MSGAAPRHDVFQAIADPTRRKLLGLLSEKEMPVKDITGHFSMTRPAVSKHLRILEEAGLVKERKVGRETRYRLDAGPLQDLKDWLSYFDRFWENKLSMLKHYVEEGSMDRETPEGEIHTLSLAPRKSRPNQEEQG